MKRIALVTYQKLPNLTADDRLLLANLHHHDIATQTAIWDAHDVAWERFDAIILRSCWDYHLRPEEFANWIEGLDKIGAPLWNLPRVVKWNMDKTYLRTISAQGFTIAPSISIEKSAPAHLKKVLEEQGWERAVVKPTISASAFQTWVVTRENAASNQNTLDEMLTRTGVIIQEFVDEVQTIGEWSFIFFNKNFSHAVLKRTKAGDFRVQQEHGGYCETKIPDTAFNEASRRKRRGIKWCIVYCKRRKRRGIEPEQDQTSTEDCSFNCRTAVVCTSGRG